MTSLSFALAQVNPTVGDIKGNASLILKHWKQAGDVDLVIFPELVLSGYPPEDLVLKAAFIEALHAEIKSLLIRSQTFKSAALIGTPWHESGKIYNAALLIEQGAIKAITFKNHLPEYGVFDEPRVFTAGPLPEPIAFRDHKLGVLICEDMWYDDVTSALKDKGAEVLIVPNGSPFETGKDETRKMHAANRVKETGLPLIYVNQVGGQDDLLFDGGSFAMDTRGTITAQLPFFTESLGGQEGNLAVTPSETASVYAALTLGLRDYVRKNGFSKVLLGLSGGVDSAIVAVIAVDALGADNVGCVMLPSRFTSTDSLEDAKLLAHNLGLKLENYSIGEPLRGFEQTLPDLAGLAHENIQSRIRGVMLMALSNARGALLLSTGNKSEMACGYATLYGDMNGAFNPLKDVYKTEVYKLCAWRNGETQLIPGRILTKAPTAELKDNQTDQDSLPPYDVLDDILHGLIEENSGIEDIAKRGHDPALISRVWTMLDRAEYKRRQACPGVKITPRAFGRDRRIPMTNRFQQ
ncbi:MAG: NAD+ synthase [Alphaproteobacteria bacterium]|nr:NAD+ synthase [Alphaproteobacteria bacterium]MCD8525676.1 NAD+ synthase [Alphaproteobacteria bacterium]